MIGLQAASVAKRRSTTLTLVAHTSAASSGGATTTTSAIDTSQADLIVASISEFEGSSPHGTFSDSKSQTWTTLTPQDNATSSRASLVYLQGFGIGSATHTFTVSSTTTVFSTIYILAFKGSASSPLDASQNGSVIGSVSAQPGSITPSQNGSVVVTALCVANGNTSAPTCTVTQADAGRAFSSGNSMGAGIAYSIQTAAGAANPTWSWTGSTEVATVIAAFHTASPPPTGGGGFVATPVSTTTLGVLDAGWGLVFDEEWNSLDTSRWANPAGPTDPTGLPALAANSTVSSGVLSMQTSGPFTAAHSAYLSTAAGGFTIGPSSGQNVYIEGRIKLPQPNQTGLYFAFWSNVAGGFPEIDILEYGLFDNSSQYDTNWHNANGAQSLVIQSCEFSAYHIYGVLWTTTSVTFYKDGVVIATASNGSNNGGGVVAIDSTPQQIILNAGGNSPGFTGGAMSASTTFPGITKIDYIHIYKQGQSSVTSQTNYGGPGSTAGPTS